MKDIVKERGNTWAYVDYDNDGDLDIIVGLGDWGDYGWDNAYDKNGNWKMAPFMDMCIYWRTKMENILIGEK